MDDVEREGAGCRLRDFQDSCPAKKRKIPRNVAETFELATELVNQKASTDAGPPTELVSVNGVLETAHAEANKAENQLTLLQQKHDTPEDDMRNDFGKAQDEWKQMAEGWPEKAVEAKNAFDKIRLRDSERVEKFFGEGDATSVRL